MLVDFFGTVESQITTPEITSDFPVFPIFFTIGLTIFVEYTQNFLLQFLESSNEIVLMPTSMLTSTPVSVVELPHRYFIFSCNNINCAKDLACIIANHDALFFKTIILGGFFFTSFIENPDRMPGLVMETINLLASSGIRIDRISSLIDNLILLKNESPDKLFNSVEVYNDTLIELYDFNTKVWNHISALSKNYKDVNERLRIFNLLSDDCANFNRFLQKLKPITQTEIPNFINSNQLLII